MYLSTIVPSLLIGFATRKLIRPLQAGALPLGLCIWMQRSGPSVNRGFLRSNARVIYESVMNVQMTYTFGAKAAYSLPRESVVYPYWPYAKIWDVERSIVINQSPVRCCSLDNVTLGYCAVGHVVVWQRKSWVYNI